MVSIASANLSLRLRVMAVCGGLFFLNCWSSTWRVLFRSLKWNEMSARVFFISLHSGFWMGDVLEWWSMTVRVVWAEVSVVSMGRLVCRLWGGEEADDGSWVSLSDDETDSGDWMVADGLGWGSSSCTGVSVCSSSWEGGVLQHAMVFPLGHR